MRNAKGKIGAVLLALALLVPLAAPTGADAATIRNYHPTDPSWAEVSNGYRITVCDWHVDGHKVYVRYRTSWPPLYPEEPTSSATRQARGV